MTDQGHGGSSNARRNRSAGGGDVTVEVFSPRVPEHMKFTWSKLPRVGDAADEAARVGRRGTRQRRGPRAGKGARPRCRRRHSRALDRLTCTSLTVLPAQQPSILGTAGCPRGTSTRRRQCGDFPAPGTMGLRHDRLRPGNINLNTELRKAPDRPTSQEDFQ